MALIRNIIGVRVAGEGPVPCKYMFVGERPGKVEASTGRPFNRNAPAGGLLTRYCEMQGIDRDEVYITNLVKDYQDEDPQDWEIARDGEELQEEILKVGPVIIGTIGAFSTKWFLGEDVDMDKMHGISKYWKSRLGREYIVIPIYHPAAGLYDSKQQAKTWWDLGQIAKGTLPHLEYVPVSYTEASGVYASSAVVAIDTEGTREKPWCVTYSQIGGIAKLVKYCPHMYYSIDKQYPVILHYAPHDLPVLRAMGIDLIKEGYKIIDTMVLANLLQVEPGGLKALAYRWLGMEMKDYQDLAGPYDREESAAWLKGAQVYNFGKRVNARVDRIVSDYIKKPGTDVRKRWSQVKEELRKPVEDMIGLIPDMSLDKVPFGEVLPYACADADGTGGIFSLINKEVERLGMKETAEMDMAIIPIVDRMMEVGIKVDQSKLLEIADTMWVEMCRVRADINEIALDVNPDSGDEVAILLFDLLKLKGRKKTKSGKRYTTEDKTLEALRRKHPVVPLVIEYREKSKIKSNFSTKLAEMADKNGRIHGDIKLANTISGRLAMAEPNLQAIPIRSDLGKTIREAFIAEEGHVIGAWDYDQIEMRVMADESEDESLLNAFRTGIDIHSQTASWMFGVPIEQVDPMKHRYPAKRIGFGIITGITGYGLMEQMALAGIEGWPEDKCDEAIELYFKARPGVRNYINWCRQEARRNGQIRDRWGRLRYLPAADCDLPYIREEALRQSHSHRIQGGAAGIIKRAMAAIWEHLKWIRERCYIEPLLQVHDELVFEVDRDWVWLANMVMIEVMEETTKLKVPIAVKGGCGPNWAEAKG